MAGQFENDTSLYVTVGRTLSFRNLSVGEIPLKAGRGQESLIDTLLKRPVPETWNKRKDIIPYK